MILSACKAVLAWLKFCLLLAFLLCKQTESFAARDVGKRGREIEGGKKKITVVWERERTEITRVIENKKKLLPALS